MDDVEDWIRTTTIWEFIFPVALPIMIVFGGAFIIIKSWQAISNFVKTVNSLVKLPEFITVTDGTLKELSDRLARMDSGSQDILRNVDTSLNSLKLETKDEMNKLNRRLDSVSAEVKEIHHQTHTNGGGSIKDDVLLIKKQMQQFCKDRSESS